MKCVVLWAVYLLFLSTAHHTPTPKHKHPRMRRLISGCPTHFTWKGILKTNNQKEKCQAMRQAFIRTLKHVEDVFKVYTTLKWYVHVYYLHFSCLSNAGVHITTNGIQTLTSGKEKIMQSSITVIPTCNQEYISFWAWLVWDMSTEQNWRQS